MRHSNPLVREALEILIAHGFTPTLIESGKHLKIIWFAADGRRHTLVISRTPSGRRARWNSRAVLRRLLNAHANGAAP